MNHARDFVDFDPLPPHRQLILAATLIVRQLSALVAGRVTRTVKFSARYYEKHWQDIGRLIPSEKPPGQDVMAFLTRDMQRPTVVKYEDRYVRVNQEDYYTFRYNEFRSIVLNYADRRQKVVEFGSGYGKNLLCIQDTGAFDEVVGYEITRAGCEAARKLLDLFGAPRVRVERHDLTDRDDMAGQDLSGFIGYTYHCLEQLNRHTEEVLENIAATGVDIVVHFEPTTELLDRRRIRDIPILLYNWRQDYQSKLIASLRRLEQRGRAEIVHVSRLPHVPGLQHLTALIVWRPLPDSGSHLRRSQGIARVGAD